MEKKYVIYLHRNKINGKCYVGQTCQKPEHRWGRNGWHYHTQEYFYRSILKYGWENFEHIILEKNISAKDVDEREVFWGEYYNSLAPNGYNLLLGKFEKKKYSETDKKNRSEISKEKWKDEEYRKKVIEGRKKMWRDSSEECKVKMLKNLDRTGLGAKAKAKKVMCVETGIIYDSMHEAQRQTNVCSNNISLVCQGKRQTAGGFHWKYYIEDKEKFKE